MRSIERAGAHDQPVGVLIVDDHPIFRQGIRHLLESEQGIRGIGEAGSIEEATGWLKTRHVDVILLDHNLPDVNGVDGMSRLFRVQATCR